jgi:hypothetical protein
VAGNAVGIGAVDSLPRDKTRNPQADQLMDARKYYFSLLTFIGSLTLGFTASAQSLQVLDGTSRQPVVGAVLTSTDPARQATSDSTGRIDLAVFPDSAWVRVEHIAFEPLRIRTSALRKLGGPLMLTPY